MTKKFFLLAITAIFGLALVMTGAFPGEVSAKTISLTYSNFFPPTHFNGKVKITYFPGGALLKGAAICDGVLKGVTDIGMSCFAYTRGRFPAMEALDLPIGYTSGYAATMVANDFFNKFMPKELDEMKVLYLHAHGPGLLHSKKAVKSLADIKGMKIRATGFSSKVCAALGAAAVGMPQGGTYEALQKGVVEGTFSPIEVLKGWKQGEVIKSTTECYSIGYTTAMYVTMNKKKWESLPADVKKVFEEVSAEWLVKHAEGWDTADAEGKKFSLGLGNQIIPLSEEESAAWEKAAAPVMEDYIKAAEGKGVPGREYVEFIKAGIKKYTK
jgi:TRAP-type C4-dicarboxylate transport system substrate-binding protein